LGDDAVAGDDDADFVPPHCLAYGALGPWASNPISHLRVSTGLTVGNSSRVLVDLPIKSGPMFQLDGNPVQVRILAAEVPNQKAPRLAHCLRPDGTRKQL